MSNILNKNFNELGVRFSKYLKAKNIGNNKFAEKIGMSKSQISNIVNGKTFGTDKMFKILNCCPDLNANWLFREEGNMLSKEIVKTDTTRIQEYEEKIRLLENTIKDKDKIIALQEKQLNYTKKGSLEMPPLPLVAEPNIKYPQSPLTQENTPKHKKESKRKR